MKIKLIIMTLLLAVGTTARGFSFSAVASTGQMLYYDVNADGTASVVSPNWDMVPTPQGYLAIPATVQNNGNTYSVSAIAQRAFASCQNLTRISIPSSVRTIGTLAFFSCTALDTIELPSSIDSIASEAFNNSGYYNNPDNWDNQSSLYIGSYLIRVATNTDGAIAVRSGTQGIGAMAFYNCTQLRSIHIPESLRFIGPLALHECNALDTLHLLCNNPPRIAVNTFDNSQTTLVEVPCGTLSSYLSASYWSAHNLNEYGCDAATIPMPASSMPISIATTAKGLSITTTETCPIHISDAAGRTIIQAQLPIGSHNFELPSSGLYIIHAPNCSPRKIIYSR